MTKSEIEKAIKDALIDATVVRDGEEVTEYSEL